MNVLQQIVALFSRWIDAVADSVAKLYGRFSPRNSLRLVERENGSFSSVAAGEAPAIAFRVENGVLVPQSEAAAAAVRGRDVEVLLDANRFMFRPLELPKRAGEFLSGVVRSQIDRLTPWSVADSAFGWGTPVETGERIVVTIAATGRSLVEPLAKALADFGAASVALMTRPPEADAAAAPIRVWDADTPDRRRHQQLRRALILTFVVAGLGALGAIGLDTVLANSIDSSQRDLARRITERRAALIAAGAGGFSDPETAARRGLERRKLEVPFSVLVIDALSQVLPDHTYVTELRIEGDRVRIIGVTADAPSLIRLIEQSNRFTRATFFAPTTRSPSDTGERFNIEARIEPPAEPRS